MPGIAFDRAVGYYDSTRGYPDGVPERIREAIVAHTGAGPDTRFLELGAGTGRIALPFVLAGDFYAGLDLSRPMMQELRRKAAGAPGRDGPAPRLAQADISHVPLAEGSVDVVIMVAVLHLVDGWQDVLGEAVRVLRKPGGWLVLGRDEAVGDVAQTTIGRLIAQWDGILAGLGIKRDGSRWGSGGRFFERDAAALRTHLEGLGGQVETLTLLEYPARPLTPRAMAQRHIDRMYSSDWRLPDDIHAEACHRILAWLDTECPHPDTPVGATHAFRATIARW